MVLLEEGRVCIKRFGRDAGSKAVVTKVIDQNFVMVISSTRPRERRSNIKHLEFISEKIDINDKAALAHTLEIEQQKIGAPAKTKTVAQRPNPNQPAPKPAQKQEQKGKK